MNDFDVVINGGGFAGLSMAAGLAPLGLKIGIIETQSIKDIASNKNDKRTTALSYFSRRYFESIGVWDAIVKNAGPINDIKILDADHVHGDSMLDLHFSKDDVAEEMGRDEPMGHIVENYLFKDALLEICLKQQNVQFFEKDSISFFEQNSAFVEIELASDITLRAKMLIGADGRGSVVRNMLGLETVDKDYNQNAITFNISHENSHNQTAIERFMPTGPFAVLPLKNEHESSIVFTVQRDICVHYMRMSEDEFKQEVRKRMGDYLGEFGLITPRSAYPLTLKYVKQYFSGRVVLVADAAHGMHPIAGQGFNQGCKDIALLVDIIKENLQLGLDIADGTSLERYQRECFNDNTQMILATNFFNTVFSNDNKVVRLGRRLGVAAVEKIHPIKRFFIKRAMGA